MKDSSQRTHLSQKEIKKYINDTFVRAKHKARPDKCLYCRKQMAGDSGFCRSHTVPQSFLRNIAVNGEVRTPASALPFLLSFFDSEEGVKRVGIFQVICRECDSGIFQEYENPENYNEPPTQKMLAQIAMKNYLRFISKRRVEYEAHKELLSSHLFRDNHMNDRQLDIDLLDSRWYTQCFRTAKNRSLKYDRTEYQIIHYVKLPYVIPIACQVALPIFFDFSGNVMNDPYNLKPSYHLWDMHICAYPFKDSSSVLLFVDTNGLRRYRKFIEQFSQFTDNEKLAIINYLIFLYSEDVYLSKAIPNGVMECESFRRVISTGTDTTVIKVRDEVIYGNDSVGVTKKMEQAYDLNRFGDIPNLLDHEYCVRLNIPKRSE